MGESTSPRKRTVGHVWVTVFGGASMGLAGHVAVSVELSGPEMGFIRKTSKMIPKAEIVAMAFPEGIPKVGDKI